MPEGYAFLLPRMNFIVLLWAKCTQLFLTWKWHCIPQWTHQWSIIKDGYRTKLLENLCQEFQCNSSSLVMCAQRESQNSWSSFHSNETFKDQHQNDKTQYNKIFNKTAEMLFCLCLTDCELVDRPHPILLIPMPTVFNQWSEAISLEKTGSTS